MRTVELPPGVNLESIEAEMSKGVLRVTVPKPAPAQAKKIDVKPAAQHEIFRRVRYLPRAPNSTPFSKRKQVIGLLTKFDFPKCFVLALSSVVPRYDELMKRTDSDVMTSSVM